MAGDAGRNDRDPFEEDTALTHLYPGEELWYADQPRGFPRRTIFLTHHQPSTAFARIGAAAGDPTSPVLMASYGRLAAAGRLDAWFWIHDAATPATARSLSPSTSTRWCPG